MTLSTRFKSKYLKIKRNLRPRTIKNILYYKITFYEKTQKAVKKIWRAHILKGYKNIFKFVFRILRGLITQLF